MREPRKKIERIALQEQVYQVLKERVLDRAYEADERLNVDALKRELNVSTTPIREALGRLAAEGLAVFEPFIGYAVVPMPSPAYFEQLFDFRLVIEPWAASETARRRPPEIIMQLQNCINIMANGRLAREYQEYRSFSEADNDFHNMIIAGAGNEPASQSYRSLRVHLQLSRLYIDSDQETVEAHQQHIALYEAIAAGDCEQAAEQMRLHLLHSKTKLLEKAPKI